MNVLEYAKGVERLINPISVGTTHYLQRRLARLPVCLQRKIITAAARKATKMGFVVEPYAFFLFYEIKKPDRIQKYLPDGFRPAPSRIFSGDRERYYGIITIFRVHTSVFWGGRIEFYAIAENTDTGLLSWVILDYLSDTISYDEMHGLRSPTAPHSIITTTCEGDFIAEMKSAEDGKRVKVLASLTHPKMRPLDERLWIEGNTSIAYGTPTGEADGDLFSLTFFPDEMREAWQIPLRDVREARVTGFPEVFGGELMDAACFPFAQHMLSDSPGNRTHYGNAADLRRAAKSVDFAKIKTLSGK